MKGHKGKENIKEFGSTIKSEMYDPSFTYYTETKEKFYQQSS